MPGWNPLGHHFADVEDPRVDRTKLHDLMDILVLSFCAVMAGASGWTDIADYATTHQVFFRRLLPLSNGIPGKDTFRRVISRIEPEQFLKAFRSWTQAVCETTEGQLLAIDGKVLRKALKENHLQALNLVSVWSVENQLTLAQIAVEEGSNEIPAVPQVLQLVKITGAIVSLDAMGCQTAIVEAIREREAEYVICLKDNQPTLYEAARDHFKRLVETGFQGMNYGYLETDNRREKARHGREERRAYYLVNVPENLAGKDEWKDLRTDPSPVLRRLAKGRRFS